MFSLFLLAAVAAFFAGATESPLENLETDETPTFSDTDLNPRTNAQTFRTTTTPGTSATTNSRRTTASYEELGEGRTPDGFDCEDILLRNGGDDGLYLVAPLGDSGPPIWVLCDMRGDGWTVIFKRYDGSVGFNRNWNQMKELVGSLEGEFWLGLEPIHRITNAGYYTIEIEGHGVNNGNWTEIYKTFAFAGEDQKYALRAEDFDREQSINKSPSLGKRNKEPFSTYDRDSTANTTYGDCVAYAEGPGWFPYNCDTSIFPFSPYRQYAPRRVRKMRWYAKYISAYPIDLSMKIRRTRF